MRLIKLLSLALLAVAALLGGFLVAAVIAGATVAAWLVRRFFFKTEDLESVDQAELRHASPTHGSSEVIDVTATEVRK